MIKMTGHIAHMALVVSEYDEAIKFYTQILGFDLIEDTRLSSEKRWVRVSPPGNQGMSLLLARAANDFQRQAIGQQSGGRVFLFLFVPQVEVYHQNLVAAGVKIRRPLQSFDYGRVFVFEDLYGNLWDAIQPSKDYLEFSESDFKDFNQYLQVKNQRQP